MPRLAYSQARNGRMITGLASRLREVRKDLGKTQAQFAELVGVGLRTYSRYEDDEEPREPTLAVYDSLLRLGISERWLRTGRGSMRAEDGRLLPDGKTDAEERVAKEIVRGLRELGERAKNEDRSPDYIAGINRALLWLAGTLGVDIEVLIKLRHDLLPAKEAEALKREVAAELQRVYGAPKQTLHPRQHK